MLFINENYGDSSCKNDSHKMKEKSDYGTQHSTWTRPRIKFLNSSNSSLGESDSKPQLKQIQFDKALIALVKNNNPIWDKNNKAHNNKEVKMQLWQSIASILNVDITHCIVRWNVLKDKFIQYKKRELDGEKLDYIEELKFLEKSQFNAEEDVLHLKKPCNSRHLTPNSSLNLINNDIENYASDSISDNELDVNDLTLVQLQKTIRGNLRDKKDQQKESNSCQTGIPDSNKANSNEKYLNMVTSEKLGKEPEDLFGELVSSFLKRIPDETKAPLMIEIMSALLKF